MQFTTLRRNSIKVAILCVSLFSTSVFALKDDTSQPLNIISNEKLLQHRGLLRYTHKELKLQEIIMAN